MSRIIRGKCVDISSEGKGVVKIGKDIYFVDGLFTGEEAEIEVTYQRSGVNFGKVKNLITKSKDRIQPVCKVCTSCGGCQYQQIGYKKQLEYKYNRVKNAIERIAKINCPVSEIIPADNPYNYRNKIQVPYSKDRFGKVLYGFFKENTHVIMPNKSCAIEDIRASSILWDIKLLLEKHNIPTYNEDNGFGILRYVLIRTSIHYSDLMVTLVTTKIGFPGQRNFLDDLLKLHPEISTVVVNENKRHTNVILGQNEKIIYGPGYIRDKINDFTFKISASSFFQVNPTQVEKLYNIAISFLKDDKSQVVLDAYAGVGTIGMIASKKAKHVYSVELNKFASRNAVENAKENNITNMTFACDDAGNFISQFEHKLDVVIMDPPRKGSDERFLSTLIKNQIPHIIYISCDPETLARDLNYLSRAYNVIKIVPVDMFPQTCHVETVVCLAIKQ